MKFSHRFFEVIQEGNTAVFSKGKSDCPYCGNLIFIFINQQQFPEVILRGDFLNSKLRNEVKLLKVYNGITYKEIAEQIQIRKDSFYNWLCGQYDFGEKRQRQLQSIIETLKEN